MSNSFLPRRSILGAAAGGVAAAALSSAALPSAAEAAGPDASDGAASDHPPGATGRWRLRWAPEPARDGLAAFETLEDDRGDSHPEAAPHIFVEQNNFRWNMHLVDRDTSTDRQRQEVTGMRTPAGGPQLEWRLGESWRVTYAMYIPSTLRATTTFTHIMQTKMPGLGTGPITVTSLRRVEGRQTIEHKIFEPDLLVGRTDLEPLQDRWIDIDYRIRIGEGTDGGVRWIIRSEGRTVLDAGLDGVDTFLGDRVRPKWGIYRSLGDTSGSLRDCYLLIRRMRGYQLVQAPEATPTL